MARLLTDAVYCNDVDTVRSLLQQGKYHVNCTDEFNRTPLHIACEKGYLNLVRVLVSNFKADVSVRDKRGKTPLHHACENKLLDVVRTMVSEFEADINAKDHSGETALQYACEKGHLDLVRALVSEFNADVSVRDKWDNTPLHYACERGHSKVVRALVSEFKADVNIKNDRGKTPLHYACERGHLEVVRTLMSEFKTDINVKDRSGKTYLHYVCGRGHWEVVKTLVSEFKANVNVKDYSGKTSLHYACEKGHLDVVRALVSKLKADVSLRDECDNTPFRVVRVLSEFHTDVSTNGHSGKTPLHYACENGHLDVVRALVSEFKANANVKDYSGKTSLHYACENGHLDVARALVSEFRAAVSVRDKWDKTPLHYACERGHSKVVRALVSEFKADVNVKDRSGKTSLHYACERGHLDVVRALVSADVSVKDEWDKTPLHHACESGHLEVVRALVSEFKADISARDKWGKTPLHYACDRGRLDVVEGLSEINVDISTNDHSNKMPLHYEYKAALTIRDADGRTPIMKAMEHEHDRVVLALASDFNCPLTDTDKNGWGLFHYACTKGWVHILQYLLSDHKNNMKLDWSILVSANNKEYDTNLVYRIMQSLITVYGYDPSALGIIGMTALHLASYRGHNNIAQALLKFTSPLVTNGYGDTPLHLAARHNRLSCVKSLLGANAPVLIRNSRGETPLDIAQRESKELLAQHIKVNRQQIQEDYDMMTRHADNRYSGSHYVTRIFVLGSPGVGKTTFIESLKGEGYFELSNQVCESSVPLHTAGIIPSEHTSELYGRVMFYDFAGNAEYYSSHAAIFESLASSKKGDNIFVIVADLRANVTAIKNSLYFWFSFIQCQNFSKASYIVLGSHLDQSEQEKCLEEFCTTMKHTVDHIKHFMLDCRNPQSCQIFQFKQQISAWVSESQKYELSREARLLLGLFEKDFSAVTACPVQTLLSHIKDSGVWLPVEPKLLYPTLLELHEVGVILLLGDCTKESDHVILKISKLTNEVHELLCTESASFTIREFNIGVLPEEILTKLLPPYITIECLIHLQYCQKILLKEIGVFSPFQTADSTSKSFLFFPALCSAEKSQVSWDESTDSHFTIGWLALCTAPHDYFPPRFLHVLLLRLVYGFTLSPAPLKTAHASPEHSRRCTMWKTGVHWLMEEGVDCMVELVDGSKGVVIFSKSSKHQVEECVRVFTKVVNCVMETKAEFCHSIKPELFLVDSSTDFLNKDHQFAVGDVERVLESPEGKHVIISVSGKRKMELSKFQCMRKLTHWDSLFPINFNVVLKVLKDIVKDLYALGQNLGASRGVLDGIEADFPYDTSRRRRELVRWWMCSSKDPPCWWHLIQALKKIDENVLAEEIRQKHDLHIRLQEKILKEEYQALKPDEEFLHLFSGVVGSRWPSLAVSLMLCEEDIEGLKKNKAEESQQESAFQMLKIWSSREGATYGQLRCKLNTILPFQ